MHNLPVLVWEVLRPFWWGVVVLDEQHGDVSVHGEVTSAFGVVPIEVNACKCCGAHPVCSDCVVLL